MKLNKLPLLLALTTGSIAEAGTMNEAAKCKEVVDPSLDYSFRIQMSSAMCAFLQELEIKIVDEKGQQGRVMHGEDVLVQLDQAADHGGLLTFSKSDLPGIWHVHSISADGSDKRSSFDGWTNLMQPQESSAWTTAE